MLNLEEIPHLNSLDRAVGQFFMQRSDTDPELLELAAALTSYALRQGHVCLDLNSLHTYDLADYIDEDFIPKALQSLRNNPLVGSIDKQDTPLILTQENKLYLHRYWHYERRLIRILKSRIDTSENPPSGDDPNDFLQPFPSLGEQQQLAVQRAYDSSLTLISGGPGTGKTTTVLYILAFLVTQSANETLKIGLAAPTGKAAQRIQDSIHAGIDQLPFSEEDKQKIGIEAVTLHRLLGYQRHSSQFIHNRDTPLALDVVIIDEASMLDLPLFTKLLEAIKPSTKLILLGDKNQLASVEAGSIFGDLIDAKARNRQLNAKVIELTENYRFGNSSTLFKTCEYVKEGKSLEALECITKGDGTLNIDALPAPSSLQKRLKFELSDHIKLLSNAPTPAVALKQLTEICILTPLRKGVYGVEGLNQTIESNVRQQLSISLRDPYYSGIPIMIIENSYSQGLFNGDIGVIFRSDPTSNELFAFFKNDNDTEPKRYLIPSLPKFETAYAITVHKSQGSEYDHILFVIPPSKSPLLTRELVYTAISRSRKSVEIWSNPDNLKYAIANQTQRSSGIREAMSE